jgi:hypothetical protein
MLILLRSYDSISQTLQQINMGNLLYIIAVILIIGWAIGFLGYHVGGGLIHILLVIAVIMIVIKLIGGSRSV